LTPNLETPHEESGERSPLLGARAAFAHFNDSESAYEDIQAAFREFWQIITSPSGRQVLKCSFAYVLGSLATFVSPIANIIGHTDGKHVVATVVVYFHPARTTGSMLEAIALAFLAFIYAALISFASMGVSVWFNSKDMLVFGHILVLVVFCGGGLGALAWLKQKLKNPLVNVVSQLLQITIKLIR
jgi:hypothetical protein